MAPGSSGTESRSESGPDDSDSAADGAGRARRPRGRAEVREALLESAQRLIARQGPSKVRLREIAEDADVNFGLVYQYLGTREELLRAVYQRVSARSATRFEHIDDLADAIDIFLTADDSVGRIMGWAALEGDPADVFGPSPGLQQVASMMVRAARQDGLDLPEDEARLLAAFLQVVALGWRLFGSIGLTGAGVEATSDVDRRVREWMRTLVESVVRGGAG
ncbi:TetR family transcriptional regulator [Frankia sp. CcI49]|uniref:TetR/AcrR family transcriptional regulator n=1 Tax=unclassified Frankia TaxID=2632575 RepID=UPI0006CA2BF7|nr:MULTISPECIES: helix-turn-helix domain-containing protein [unclassified Frankia]KPM52063.1 TetR family transcriptional regulator [Frankia sp. R43]ONH58859.1 TetR family transcriptional regulator [Frankia sp. CcI49]